MALYNIFGTSDDWDEQTLGYLRTIEVDPALLGEALRHVAEEELLDTDDDERVEDIRVVVGTEGVEEMFDTNEVCWPFSGAMEEFAAYAELDRDPYYSRMWVAVPCEVTTLVIGEVADG